MSRWQMGVVGIEHLEPEPTQLQPIQPPRSIPGGYDENPAVWLCYHLEGLDMSSPMADWSTTFWTIECERKFGIKMEESDDPK